jgi:fumarate reductase subunit C
MFVAWFVVYLLLLVNSVIGGPGSYGRFLEWSATPWVVTLNVVSFLFIVYHAITFFVAAPQAMVVQIGRERVPGFVVLAGHYVAWAAASGFVFWLLLGA